MTSNPFRVPDRRSAVVGVVLFAIAAVTYWDASRMVVRAGYGMGANTTSYFVAVLFALLAIGHLVGAFKPSSCEAETADWKAVGFIAIALTGLVATIWLGGGFILGSTSFSHSRREPSGEPRFRSTSVSDWGSASSCFSFSTSS